MDYHEQLDSSNRKVVELTHVNTQAQIRRKDMDEVLKTLEERLRITEVRTTYYCRMSRASLDQYV